MGELEQYLVPIRRYSANPCMDCCCPISKCPWLREGKPVPGWTAKKRTFIVGRSIRRKALGDYIRHRELPAGTR